MSQIKRSHKVGSFTGLRCPLRFGRPRFCGHRLDQHRLGYPRITSAHKVCRSDLKLNFSENQFRKDHRRTLWQTKSAVVLPPAGMRGLPGRSNRGQSLPVELAATSDFPPIKGTLSCLARIRAIVGRNSQREEIPTSVAGYRNLPVLHGRERNQLWLCGSRGNAALQLSLHHLPGSGAEYGQVG